MGKMTLISALKSLNVIKEFLSVVPILPNHVNHRSLRLAIVLNHFSDKLLDLSIGWLPIKLFADGRNVFAKRSHVEGAFNKFQLFKFVQITDDDHDRNHVLFDQPSFRLETFYDCCKFFIICHSRHCSTSEAEVKC